MPYEAAAEQQLFDYLDQLKDKADETTDIFTQLQLESAKAIEYRDHGFLRRMTDMQHNINRVFAIIAPTTARPSRDERMDATAFLHSHLINVQGAIDNLAHIWVAEAAPVRPNGTPLGKFDIGLRPAKRLTTDTLSASTQAYLASLADWFEYIDGYRDALAHRIPPYIPPITLDDERQKAWRDANELQLGEGWAFEDWMKTLNAIHQGNGFEPMMMHSFGEQARPVYFHPQILIDLHTVIEAADHIARDLQARHGH